MRTRAFAALATAGILLLSATTQARAQDHWLSPAIGRVSAGAATVAGRDETYPTSTGFGGSVADLFADSAFGVEFGTFYARNFFGDDPSRTAHIGKSLTTIEEGVLFKSRTVPLSGYGDAGTTFTLESGGSTPNGGAFGIYVGGGLLGFATERIGVRFDVRYIYHLSDFGLFGDSTLTDPPQHLRFVRVSFGPVFRF